MNSKTILQILLLGVMLGGCAGKQVLIESDPTGASIYRTREINGCWSRVVTDSDVTPLHIKFLQNEDTFVKAKMYGYEDSEIVSTKELSNDPSYLFHLRQLGHRNYDPFYQKSILNPAIEKSNKKNVAVMDFTQKGNLNDEELYYATVFLQDALFKSGAFNLVDRRNVNRVLEELKFQLTGITDSEKALVVGKMLNVHEMVFGNLGTMGDKRVISLFVIDVETSGIVHSDNRQFEDNNELGEIVVSIVNQYLIKRFNVK